VPVKGRQLEASHSVSYGCGLMAYCSGGGERACGNSFKLRDTKPQTQLLEVHSRVPAGTQKRYWLLQAGR